MMIGVKHMNTTIQCLGRAIAILDCFKEIEELGVTEISNRIGLHKSTTFNIISTLEHYRYLEKNENTGKYHLGIELFRMGTKVHASLRKIVAPYLEKLVSQFKETVNLVTRDSNHVIYLEKIESPHSMRISTTEGSRLPINTTAVGKAILAGLPDDELMEVINRIQFVKFTDHTVCNKKKFYENIQKVRALGYAEDFEELEIGLTCVASPIFNHTGKSFAAISVSGPTSRMNNDVRKEISKVLMEVTQEISQKIGYN